MTKSIKITLAGIDVEVPIPKGLRGGTRDFMKGIRFAEKIEAPQDETAKNAEKALENLKPNTPPRVIIAYVNKAMPRHPAIKLAQKLESMGLAKAGVKQASAMIHGSNDKTFMQALSTNPFWAGVVAAGRALTKSDIDTEKFDREQWNRLSQKAIETIGYEGQDEPGAFKKKLAQRKAIRAIFGESIDRGQSMNVESINALLVKAIGQIQEQELSSVVEARTKKEQAAIDKATLKKHGVKFRSTDDGGVLAVTKQGDIVSDEPPAKTKGKSPAKKKTKTPKQQAATAKKHIDKMLAKKGLEAEVGPQGDGQFVVKIGKKGEKYQPVKWSIDTSSKKYPVVETESGGYGYDTFKTAQKLKKELIKTPKMFE